MKWFACTRIWIWNRTLNFFPPCRERASRDDRLTASGIYIGKYKQQRGALCSIWNRTEKRHCILELESGDKILPAEAAAIALKSYTPRTWGCAWLPLGLQLGRIQVAFEPCLGRVWAVVGPWLGHIWFALEMMRLECIRITLGSRLSCVRQHSGSI